MRLLPFSVPRVLRARVVPLLDARPPVPGVMLCGAMRRAGVLLLLGAVVDGVDGFGSGSDELLVLRARLLAML